MIIDKWRNGFNEEIDYFPERLRDFRGKTLRATSFDFPPYNYRVFDSDGNYLRHEGAEYRLAAMIGESLNFKIKVQAPTDNGLWGLLGKFNI